MKQRCQRGGHFIEIIRDDQKRVVQVWLSNLEKNDTQIQNRLQSFYTQWKKEKYLVGVFVSGEGDLYQNTLSLLAFNKRRTAELAVQNEKQVAR